jgi:virginiamycin B lyase
MLLECSRFVLAPRTLAAVSLVYVFLIAPRSTLASSVPTVDFAGCADQCITEFELPRPGSRPFQLVVGPDNALWFTEKGPQCGTDGGYAIGRLDTDGTITEHPVNYPSAIVVGPDSAFWFGEQIANKIGRLTTEGNLTEFPVPATGKLQFRDCTYESSSPAEGGFLVGPDANLWFTEQIGNNLARMSLDGHIDEFAVPTPNSGPLGMVVGPDNAFWFIERRASKVGRMTVDGTFDEYAMSTANAFPNDIVVGPDGNLWFTELMADRVGRITTDGVMTEYPALGAGPVGIVVGPDGGLWLAGYTGNEIVRMTTTGEITNRYPVPAPNAGVLLVVVGPDGNIWFSEDTGNKIGRLDLAATVSGAPVGSTAESSQARPVDLASVYQQWVDALNRGDVDAATDLFVEDALYKGGAACTPFCRSRDELRREIQGLADDHTQITATRARVSNTTTTRWLTTWNEVRSDATRAGGAERALSVTTLGARSDQIAFLITQWDRTDGPTDAFLTAVSSPAGSGPLDANAPPPQPAAYGRMVDIGGRRLYLECLGEGSPTVILEGGLSSSASRGIWNVPAWAPQITIQPDLATVTRVCAYDRAGFGLSDPGPTPQTAVSVTSDLHALLHAAGLEPPYVLAGISLGGPIVQVFASRFPDEVVGLVEIDPGPLVGYEERIQALLPPELAARRKTNVERDNARTASSDGPGGGYDMDAFLAQVRDANVLPHVPLVVLSAIATQQTNPLSWPPDYPQDSIEQIEQARLDAHAALAKLVPGGKHILVDNSDHSMNVFTPQAITDAIKGVLSVTP